jgi:hypothetical protein
VAFRVVAKLDVGRGESSSAARTSGYMRLAGGIGIYTRASMA